MSFLFVEGTTLYSGSTSPFSRERLFRHSCISSPWSVKWQAKPEPISPSCNVGFSFLPLLVFPLFQPYTKLWDGHPELCSYSPNHWGSLLLMSPGKFLTFNQQLLQGKKKCWKCCLITTSETFLMSSTSFSWSWLVSMMDFWLDIILLQRESVVIVTLIDFGALLLSAKLTLMRLRR